MEQDIAAAQVDPWDSRKTPKRTRYYELLKKLTSLEIFTYKFRDVTYREKI